jgi:GTPase SAR1 family protein
MRIILEGPDNAGKTTLANRIKHALGPRVDYFHPGGKPDDLEAEALCIEVQLDTLRASSSIIMDRCTPISQVVYNPDPELVGWRDHMWQRYLELDIVLIYCRPSTDRLLRVQDLTWREGETEEHKQKIIANQHTFVQRYDAIMQGKPNLSYEVTQI